MWSFIKIYLIYIIGINSIERKMSQKNTEYMLIYTFSCRCSYNLSSFWFEIKQKFTTKEISIFSNSSHFEWKSDIILKGTHPRTIPTRFGVIWFSSFRGKDLNVIFYQNMPNLHNRYKSAERKICVRWAKSITSNNKQWKHNLK